MAEVRLQVLLARSGVASRRAAERLIREGRVSKNGEIVLELGTKADPDRDTIQVDGRRLEADEPRATIVLYKPDAVVTTMHDPEGRETIRELVGVEPYRLVPVGRLDFHSEGLLVLSNDGDLIHRLLHPRHHVPKVYAVEIPGVPTQRALDRLRRGVDLDDGRTSPAEITVLESSADRPDARARPADREDANDRTWLEITVHEGRNRLIRRMCDAVGHPARRVVRTRFASLDLGALRPGQYRYLRGRELEALYALAGRDAPAPCREARSGGVLGVARRGRGRVPGQPSSSVSKAAGRVRS